MRYGPVAGRGLVPVSTFGVPAGTTYQVKLACPSSPVFCSAQTEASPLLSVGVSVQGVPGRGSLAKARRLVNRYLTDETLTRHLFTVIAPEFKETQGGYTRMIKIGQRRGDAARIVLLELATEKELGTPVLPEKIGTRRVDKTY